MLGTWYLAEKLSIMALVIKDAPSTIGLLSLKKSRSPQTMTALKWYVGPQEWVALAGGTAVWQGCHFL
jgi:hypothetical protein